MGCSSGRGFLVDDAALRSPAGPRFQISGISIRGISSRSNATNVDLRADSAPAADDPGSLADGSGRSYHDSDASIARFAQFGSPCVVFEGRAK
jgi:hypothetical protein